MASISLGNIAPSLGRLASGGMDGYGVLKSLLDFVFTDSALLFQQPSKLVGGKGTENLPIGLPLIGFSFKTPDMLTFCKYSYGEYPYLNKAVVANAFYKEPGDVEIVGLRPIQRTNPVIANYVLNKMAVKYYIERYADAGGLFAINTLWGYYDNLALTQLDGIKIEESELGGIGFKFTFRRLNFSSIDDDGFSISDAVGAL